MNPLHFCDIQTQNDSPTHKHFIKTINRVQDLIKCINPRYFKCILTLQILWRSVLIIYTESN